MRNTGSKLAQNCPLHQRIRLPGSILRRDNCTDESLPKGTDQEKLIHCDTAYDTLNFGWNESRMITMSCTVYECLRVCGYIMTHYQLTEKYENYNERFIERNTEEKGTVGYDDTTVIF